MIDFLQGELELQAGILQAASGNFTSAFNYFTEAFCVYTSCLHAETSRALKYMILCQIMLKDVVKVKNIFRDEVELDCEDAELECLRVVTAAVEANSIQQFQTALHTFPGHMQLDLFIRSNLETLYHTILQDNIINIILPFSRLQIPFIAEKIGIPSAQVMVPRYKINAPLYLCNSKANPSLKIFE